MIHKVKLINSLDFIQIKNFVKDTFQRLETKFQHWKDILGKHMSDKLLKPEYRKNCQKSITIKRMIKIDKKLNKYFSKEDVWMTNKHMRRL